MSVVVVVVVRGRGRDVFVMRVGYEFLQTLNFRPLLWKVLRYVDNRLALFVKVGAQSSLPPSVGSAGFYGEPVVLEPEPDLSYVGCVVHTVGQ